MKTSTLTSKGQFTLPKSVRDRLDLKPGDILSFEVEGDDTVKLKVHRRRTLSELRGSLSSDRRYPGRETEREAAGRWISRAYRDGSP